MPQVMLQLKKALPVEPETPSPEPVNMAYAGGFLSAGQGTGIVIAIGRKLKTSQSAQLVVQPGNLTHH